MTTTNTTPNKSATKTPAKTNGSPEHSEQPAAHTSPTTAPTADKKPITVMLTEQLHRKVKITAELSGVSLSDLIEAQLKVLVKERLPGLLSQLGDEP